MRLLPTLAALSLLAACDQALTKTPDYRPQDAGSVDRALCLLGFSAVPVTEVLTGHHLVEAVVNGRKGVFVLDTGANISTLHAPLAADYKLKPALGGLMPAVGVGVGGAQKAGVWTLDSLTIGGIAIRQTRMMTADLTPVVRMLSPLAPGKRVDGIIGQDVMKEHRGVIDVAKPILYLIAEDKDPAPVDAAESCTGGAAAASGTE
ncbi:retropepsin-like aspartic protease [Sphingoaurantiacus capsulatus]|uniref:Retropepsin-like aspartic protease n=1 Tax=Sphingoaurantiacus capsulatus TaxID=1771310 RepID=A0ABV7X7M3_9SPHN